MTNTPASDLLRADHRKMETHLDGLLDALKHLSASRVGDIRQHFVAIQKIAQTHFDWEEGVFYPEVRSLAPEVLVKMDEEHDVVRETEKCLGEFLKAFPAAPTERDLGELYRLGVEFHDAVQTHIVDEEDHLLKFVDRVLTVERQASLAAAMLKMSGPGR